MSEKLYRLAPPVGTNIVPKEWMSEKEVREFGAQIANYDEVWSEKIMKEPISDVVEWFRRTGYTVTEK